VVAHYLKQYIVPEVLKPSYQEKYSKPSR